MKQYKVNGKTWTVESIAEHCGVSQSAIRKRIILWQSGRITDAELLHKGKMWGGGNKGTHSGSRATAEYRKLDNTAKSMKPIDCTPGTWERKHIKLQERQKSRRYVKSTPRDKGEREIHYNPVRVAL